MAKQGYHQQPRGRKAVWNECAELQKSPSRKLAYSFQEWSRIMTVELIKLGLDFCQRHFDQNYNNLFALPEGPCQKSFSLLLSQYYCEKWKWPSPKREMCKCEHTLENFSSIPNGHHFVQLIIYVQHFHTHMQAKHTDTDSHVWGSYLLFARQVSGTLPCALGIQPPSTPQPFNSLPLTVATRCRCRCRCPSCALACSYNNKRSNESNNNCN